MGGATLKQTFDLMPSKAKNLDLPDGKIFIDLQCKEIDPSTLARIMEPVWSYLDDYRKVAIAPTIAKYDAQLAEADDLAQAERVAKQVNAELDKLTKNLKAEAERRIKASWDKQKKQNRAYAKYRLKIGAKITLGVVKITKSVAALVMTGGAKVDEYFKIAKSVIAIGKQLKRALDDEAKAREQLMKAVEKMAKTKKTGVADRSKIQEVEKAVGFYRNKLTGVRKKAAGLSGKLDRLLVAAEEADVSAKQRAQVDAMIREVERLNENEKAGRHLADHAEALAKDTRGRLDAATVRRYAQKAKKAFDTSRKVFEAVADLV